MRLKTQLTSSMMKETELPASRLKWEAREMCDPSGASVESSPHVGGNSDDEDLRWRTLWSNRGSLVESETRTGCNLVKHKQKVVNSIRQQRDTLKLVHENDAARSSLDRKTSEAEPEQHVQYEEQEKENQKRNLDVKRLMMARLSEVLHVDWDTDERTDVDCVAQWEQRLHEFETMAREMLRAISAGRSPSKIRTYLLVNTQSLMQHVVVRAAIEEFPTVGRRRRQEQDGSTLMDIGATTRKGKWHEGKSRSKDYNVNRWNCKSGKGGKDKDKDKNTGEKKTVRLKVIMTVSMQLEPAQHQLSEWTEILTDSVAAEHVRGDHHFPGAPVRSSSRTVLRTADGAKVRTDRVKQACLMTTNGEAVTIEFRVANIAHPTLSVQDVQERHPGRVGPQLRTYKRAEATRRDVQ